MLVGFFQLSRGDVSIKFGVVVRKPFPVVLKIVLLTSASFVMVDMCLFKCFFVLNDRISGSKQKRYPFAHFVFSRVGDKYFFMDGRIFGGIDIEVAACKLRIRREREGGIYDRVSEIKGIVPSFFQPVSKSLVIEVSNSSRLIESLTEISFA